MGGLGQTHGIGQHQLGFMNDGHQAGLEVHQHQLRVLVVEQHKLYPRGL